MFHMNQHFQFPGIIIAVLFFMFAVEPVIASTYETEHTDKTLSPYFLVLAENEGEELLPLKETSAVVDIAGIIADVKVTQIYKNTGAGPLEAIYVFPGSTRSAVYGMKMTIGDRVREAEIRERKAAKKEYKKAKEEGKSASLLEQQRPNVFQMSVANIMPGDEIRVEFFYTENLVPTDGIYEFVYPTVVGPRYSDKPAAAAPPDEHWIANPFQREGQLPMYNFNIRVNLAAGIPIQEIRSSSHKVDITYKNSSLAAVALNGAEKLSGNRDYILKYRLQDRNVESGLLLYEGDEENFFLLTMEPPERAAALHIPPREYIYIVDVSGSMNGFPLQISKKLIRTLVSNLRPADSFNVLLFASSSNVLSGHSLPATAENIDRAVHLIDSQQGGGGTNLLPALKRALHLPHEENTSRTIVIATDGYVAVEKEAFDLIRNNLNNANVFAFGIGSSVNRFLIEGIARAGSGEPFVITEPVEAPAAAEKFRKYIESPVLTNIAIDYGDFDVYDIEPPSIPDVLAERPVVVFGKWKGKPSGSLSIRGHQGKGMYEKNINISEVTPSAGNSALRYLWARHRIMTLGDYNQIDGNDDLIHEITSLGLAYNLLTEYTSFIAVDYIVRNISGSSRTVKQPLPLPKGVSDMAVGGGNTLSVPMVPEPESYMLMASGALIFLWTAYARRRKNRFAVNIIPERRLK